MGAYKNANRTLFYGFMLIKLKRIFWQHISNTPFYSIEKNFHKTVPSTWMDRARQMLIHEDPNTFLKKCSFIDFCAQSTDF